VCDGFRAYLIDAAFGAVLNGARGHLNNVA
jgi:hypothetical protein